MGKPLENAVQSRRYRDDLMIEHEEAAGRRVKRLSSNTKPPWVSIEDFQFIQVI